MTYQQAPHEVIEKMLRERQQFHAALDAAISPKQITPAEQECARVMEEAKQALQTAMATVREHCARVEAARQHVLDTGGIPIPTELIDLGFGIQLRL